MSNEVSGAFLVLGGWAKVPRYLGRHGSELEWTDNTRGALKMPHAEASRMMREHGGRALVEV